MKRFLALILALLMVVTILASCGGGGNNKNTEKPEDEHEHGISTDDNGNGDDNIGEKECNHKGGKATCTQKAVCILCNKEYGGFNHQYTTIGEIKDCGGNTVFEAKICIECGSTEKLDNDTVVIHPHSFVRREPKKPTCTEKGITVWFECENCGYNVKTTVNELGHLWGNYEQYDEFYHTCECLRNQCDADDKQLHSVNSWSISSMPTCTKDGSMGGYCVHCGYYCTRKLPAGHSYDDGKITKDPTCTENGIKLYTCTECGHIEEEDVASLGHNFLDYVLTNTNPENPCEHVADCSRCDATDYKTIHDEEPWTLTNSNPENPCEHSKQCSRCERMVYETIHDYDGGTINKAPTCLESGNKLYVCQRCDFEKNETLNTYGHDEEIFTYKDPTCTEDGYTIYRCKRCDHLRSVSCKMLGHDVIYEYNDDCHWKKCTRCKSVLSYEEEHKLEVKFDKEKKGTETIYSLYYFCDICEYKRIIKEGIAHVHNEAEIIDVAAPTCTEGGYLPGLKCATPGCNEIFIEPEAVGALGHVLGFYNICIRCGYEKHSEGLNYILSEDETYYVVTGIGTCTDIHINIPSIYNEKSVKEIAPDAFKNKDTIVSAKIPDSVTSIGDYAFHGCSKLTSVTIGNCVESIGDCAFYRCDGLTSIDIPHSVTSIEESSFRCCERLESIFVDEENKKYSSSGNCLIEKQSKTLILGCKNSVIPTNGSVTNIGNYAFYFCTGLTSIDIPDNVTRIDYAAFLGCSSLTSVTIPDSVKSTGRSAFYGCSSLTSVIIPDSVTSIDSDAFGGCSNLTSVTIPDSVTSIYDGAFYNCFSLTSVTIPDSVISIGDSAFHYTGYYNNKSNWENGVLYIGKYLIDAETTISGEYNIKSGTKLIADGAFEDCSSLTSVIIPDSVMSIGDATFEDCSGLTSVTIPDSVTSIGNYAFKYCFGLTSVTIGNRVTRINDYAFLGCGKLVEVINRSSLNITICENSWFEYGSVAYYALEVHNGKTKIVNKDGYLFYTYDDVNYLLGYVGEDEALVLPDNYYGQFYEMYQCAFECCSGLTSVIIPDSITKISASAFNGCTRLTSITIPDSVISIGNSAFNGCTGLTSITIPDSVISIGNSAFNGCSSLTNINIPDSVTRIGASAFSGCASLMKVTIPDSITSISGYAFKNCTALSSITIPNNVMIIEIQAFEGCNGLKNVEFKNTEGWWLAINPFVTSGPSVSSSSLADKSTAATYLNSTYVHYIWKRSTT